MLVELRNEEQTADRHAVASGENERQHDENRMVYIRFGTRGSETSHEEQHYKLGEDSTLRTRSSKYTVIFNHACVSRISWGW